MLRSVKLQSFEQLAANSLSDMPKTIKGFSTADFLHLGFNVISESRCSDIVNSQRSHNCDDVLTMMFSTEFVCQRLNWEISEDTPG